MPVSRTSTTAKPSPSLNETSTLPFKAVYFTALSIKIKNSRRRELESPKIPMGCLGILRAKLDLFFFRQSAALLAGFAKNFRHIRRSKLKYFRAAIGSCEIHQLLDQV